MNPQIGEELRFKYSMFVWLLRYGHVLCDVMTMLYKIHKIMNKNKKKNKKNNRNARVILFLQK